MKKSKNTHTTKKYAIEVIAELREKAIKALGGIPEPCLEEHKKKRWEAGNTSLIPQADIAVLVDKEINNGEKQLYRRSTDLGMLSIKSLIPPPASYLKELRKYEKEQPAREKKIKAIDSAYETAERTIMLGGSDTLIGDAIAKMEKQLNL